MRFVLSPFLPIPLARGVVLPAPCSVGFFICADCTSAAWLLKHQLQMGFEIMTCRLQEASPLDTLYARCRAYPGGIAALAQRLESVRDVRTIPTVLHHKLSSMNTRHHLSLDEFDTLLRFTADARVEGWSDPLQALAWSHGFLLVPMPSAEAEVDEALMQSICTAVHEQGLAIAEVGHALANDNAIDSREMAAIEAKAANTMNAFAVLWETVRSLHRAAIDKGLVR